MKMSYLGIDNTYRDAAVSAGAYTTDPHLIAKLDFATEALQRWAQKYPNDPQLPRSYFLAVQVLRKVYTQPEQQMTWGFIELLVSKYRSSYFGKVMTASLKTGYTEHWFALAQICPTPLPLGVMPETTPNATPSPSPGPGHPAINIITPPCVEPSPVPTEAPEEMPAPENTSPELIPSTPQTTLPEATPMRQGGTPQPLPTAPQTALPEATPTPQPIATAPPTRVPGPSVPPP